MVISKKTTIVSVSAATLILILAIAAFIWLRLMEIPSDLNIAVKQDIKTAGMETQAETPQMPVTRMKIPPPPPEIKKTAPQSPEVTPPVMQSQTEVIKTESQIESAKQVPSKEAAPTMKELAKAEPSPPAPKTGPKVPEPQPQIDAGDVKKRLPKKPEPVISPEDQNAFAFTMQVGAFLKKKNAEERIHILKQMGRKPYPFEVTDKKGTTWHTVRIGSYQTLGEARKDLKLFKNTSPFDAVVMLRDSLSPPKKNQRKRSQGNASAALPGT